MLNAFKAAWIVGKYSVRARASVGDALELWALAIVAMARKGTATEHMAYGQFRAKAKRMRGTVSDVTRTTAAVWA